MNQLNLILSIVSFVLSFVLTFFLTRRGIPFLKKKHMGQMILEIGPQWHKKKEGTPTMGGIFFVLSTVAVYCIVALPQLFSAPVFDPTSLWIVLFLLGHAMIGFADDYVKFTKHQNKGLSALQKLILQFAVTALFLYAYAATGHARTYLVLPFTNGMKLELGIFYYLFILVFLVFVINAVNLTDGLDGLAASNMSVSLLFYLILSMGIFLWSADFGEEGAKSVLYLALLGALLAFLIFNRHPAKIFMGDTGSLFLGAVLSAAALWQGLELSLFFCGAVFLFEAFSVMLQVTYFKISGGKRIFKMAPFHHHLEKCGYTENRIVGLFVILTTLACAIAYFVF